MKNSRADLDAFILPPLHRTHQTESGCTTDAYAVRPWCTISAGSTLLDDTLSLAERKRTRTACNARIWSLGETWTGKALPKIGFSTVSLGSHLKEGKHIANLTEYLKRHQLLAYFVLTYLVTWTLLILFQPLYLEGQRIVAPLLSLGIFAPAMVGIGLSAMVNPRPIQGSRNSAAIAFAVVWILASLIIILYLTINQQMDLSIRLVSVSVITGLLPAFVGSSIFSTIPGVRDQLRTYIKPRGSWGYYFLALVLIPAIWLLGNLLSRSLGTEVPYFRNPVVDVKLLGMVLLFFLYNVLYGALSEEPGWRGFALPRLQARFSPLVSSLILGVIWAVWHAPGKFGGIETSSLTDTLVEWVLIVLVTIIFTWLFNRTKGSILVTALIHPAMNTTGNFLNASIGALILVLVFTVFVIVLDKMWRRLPADSPAIFLANTQAAHRLTAVSRVRKKIE